MITAGKQFDPQSQTITSQEENLKPTHRHFKYTILIPVLSYSLSLYIYPSYLSIKTTILVFAPLYSIFLRFYL